MNQLPQPPDTPLLTVIVPTRNRLNVLQKCLAALDAQTLAAAHWELVIVDDGSTDGTRDYLQDRGGSRPFRMIATSAGGPAKARNAGIRVARGEILVFIGNDILPTPTFLEHHLAWHRRYDVETTAILGRTEWVTTEPVTPLMRYQRLGQFDYHRIGRDIDPQNLPFSFFYTSNVSVRRSFLEHHHLLFDEDFRHAMGEDGELGYRAQRQGLRLRYNPEALAYHEHPTTFLASRARFHLKGRVTILQASKHPDWADLSFLSMGWRGRLRHHLRRLAASLLAPMLALADRLGLDIDAWRLGRALDFVFETAEIDGMLQALASGVRRASAGPPQM